MIKKNNNSANSKQNINHGKKNSLGTVKKRYIRVENEQFLKLSLEQIEVLNYTCDDFMTAQQIADKRGTKLPAVYKTLTKLKKKGVLKRAVNSKTKGTVKRGGDSSHSYKLPSKIDDLRLHAQSFQIEILETSPHYLKLIKKNKNVGEYENNTLRLYEDNITIYLLEDFWGSSVDNCLRNSLDYMNRFIAKLENEYKITLKKGRRCNLREFRGEIAKVNDPIAREINIAGEKFVVYDSKGVKRLLVDKSFKFDELEAVSKHYAKDFRRVEKQYKSLLEMKEEPFTPEQILGSFKSLEKLSQQNQSDKNDLLLMIRELTESNKILQEEIIKLKDDRPAWMNY